MNDQVKTEDRTVQTTREKPKLQASRKNHYLNQRNEDFARCHSIINKGGYNTSVRNIITESSQAEWIEKYEYAALLRLIL